MKKLLLLASLSNLSMFSLLYPMDEQTLKARNELQRSQEFKLIPNGPREELNELFYVNNFKSKIEEKNKSLKQELDNYKKNYYLPNHTSLDGYKNDTVLDYKNLDNHLILLVHNTCVYTIPHNLYYIFDKKHKHIETTSAYNNIKQIDTFTTTKDLTAFFTVGSDTNNNKKIEIKIKKTAWPTTHTNITKNSIWRYFNFICPNRNDNYIETLIDIENATYIGAEFLKDGRLALLKDDNGVVFVDLKKYPELKTLFAAKPIKNLNKKSNNDASLYTVFGAAALIGLAWYYNPGSIVDTVTSFFRNLWQRRIEN